MRRHGELGWLFVHAMPSKPLGSASGAKINVPVEEVLPVLAVLAASLLVASLFLATERLIKPKSRKRPNHFPFAGAAGEEPSFKTGSTTHAPSSDFCPLHVRPQCLKL
jgi:hypothetical protein